jgi:hypothetical protein
MTKIISTKKYLMIINRISILDDRKRMQIDYSNWKDGNMITITGILFSWLITKLPQETMTQINKIMKNNESKD